MPPIAFGLARPGATAAWATHLAVGSAFAVVIGLLAASGTGAGNIAEVSGRALGHWA